MNKLGVGAAVGLCAALCGCHAYSEYSNSSLGDTKVMLTTADVRMTTERTGPTGAKVFCAEPSPDVAKAFSTAMQLSASAAGKMQAGVAASAAEQLAQLSNRVPSIQALRDGLYRACEAYSNGVLGPNAYAVILSRYGDILVTLILAEDAAGNFGGNKVTLTPSPPALPSPGGGGGNSQQAPGGQGGNGGASPAHYQQGITPTARLIKVSMNNQAKTAAPDQDPAAAPAAPCRQAGARAAACVTKAHPKKKPGGSAGGGGSNGNGATAAVVEAMQRNYFEITSIPAAPMFVMCANMIDPDRPHWANANNVTYEWNRSDGADLKQICLDLMRDVEKASALMLNEQVRALAAANRRGGGR